MTTSPETLYENESQLHPTMRQRPSFRPFFINAAPFLAFAALEASCLAGPQTVDSTATTETAASTRYGLFNLLDHRSSYGQGVFPEPFLVDDSDLEPGEARLDWLHSHTTGQQNDRIKGEIEQAFGVVTLELEVPFERTALLGQKASAGWDNIDIGARCPVYQYVSPGDSFDTTFGVAMEVGVPIDSTVSRNSEFVPKVFNDTKFGAFTLQSILGYSVIAGPGEDGGLQTFEYSCVLGYTIPHEKLPIPGVLEVIPVCELIWEKPLNHANIHENGLTADAGVRVNLASIGPIQPRLGVSFVFPLNSTSRQDTHWGIATSLVFQY